jgi:hypothetical protein
MEPGTHFSGHMANEASSWRHRFPAAACDRHFSVRRSFLDLR